MARGALTLLRRSARKSKQNCIDGHRSCWSKLRYTCDITAGCVDIMKRVCCIHFIGTNNRIYSFGSHPQTYVRFNSLQFLLLRPSHVMNFITHHCLDSTENTCILHTILITRMDATISSDNVLERTSRPFCQK